MVEQVATKGFKLKHANGNANKWMFPCSLSSFFSFSSMIAFLVSITYGVVMSFEEFQR